jgi:DNA gyrase inhibitor GyrI
MAMRASSVRCSTMRHVRVERDDTPVMFVEAEGDPRMVSGAAERAFSELESRLGTLRGRRFFGVFDPASSAYLACVQTRDGDDARALGLGQTVIPGGAYLRATVTGQPPAVYALIGPTFEELERQDRPDSNRPLIEFYRRHNEIDLLVPVV